MNYHFVQQEDWNDCGLACLAMLIENYQRRRISVLQLKNQLNSEETNGLSFFTLIELGQKYLLNGEGFNCEMSMLSQNAHLCPMIINVKNQEGISHYVILNKIENEVYYLNDPSQHQPLTKLSFAELNQIFLNKILIFKKAGRWKPKINLAFLHQWLKQFYLYLFLLVSFALLANFFWLLSSGFIKIFSQWVRENQINWWELGFFLVFVFCGCFFDFCQSYFSWVLSQKTWWQLLNHFLNQQAKGIEERVLNRNLVTLKENLEFLQLFWKIIIESLIGIIFIPVLEIWISWINPLFCFLPVLWMLIIFFGKVFVKKKLPHQKLKLKFSSEMYQQSLNHYFNFAKVIQDRGLKKVFLKNLEIQFHHSKVVSGQIHQFHFLIKFWEKFWLKIFYFILLIVVFYSFQIKSLNNGDLLYLIILSNYLLSLLNQTVDSWLSFYLVKDQNQGLEAIFEKEKTENFSFSKIKEVSFENLSFKNPTGTVFTINQKFTASFFVTGDERIVEKFFQFIFETSTDLTKIKINQRSWEDFKDDFFILRKKPELLPGTLTQNLFNWNPNLDSQIFHLLNPLSWLEKYEIDFSQQTSIQNLNLQQKQLVNFLATFFSLHKIFIFENCLSELEKTDQEKLVQLFLKLKPDSFLIFSSQNLSLERNFSQKLVLSPMI